MNHLDFKSQKDYIFQFFIIFCSLLAVNLTVGFVLVFCYTQSFKKSKLIDSGAKRIFLPWILTYHEFWDPEKFPLNDEIVVILLAIL